jgi:hypothetical protein
MLRTSDFTKAEHVCEKGRGRVARAHTILSTRISGYLAERFAHLFGRGEDTVLVPGTSTVEEKIHGLLIAEEVNAIVKVLEVIEEVDLPVDVGILRERFSVGLEDELTDKVSGILQPDTGSERVRGVHHFVLVDLRGHRYLFLALGGAKLGG